MSSTVQVCLAQSSTLWRVCCGLVTDHIKSVATTATWRGDPEIARLAFADMAWLCATMSARQFSTTLPLTTGDWISAFDAGFHIEISECRLATGTMSYHIDSPGTVWRCCVLRMTRLFTMMNATVHKIVTYISTVKGAHPICALFLLASIIALELLLDFTTVTSCINFGSASTAKSFVAGALTCVLATGHDITTYCITAPTRLVIRFYTPPCGFLLPAVATLLRTHGRAGWTRTGVT
jgi:hypothetical protein